MQRRLSGAKGGAKGNDKAEMRTRLFGTLIALSSALCACGETQRAKPNLPESVSPGWKLTSLDRSTAPPYVPYPSSRHSPVEGQQVSARGRDCWQANYAGADTAQIRICRYSATDGAFDAWQRVRADAGTVKFQEREYLVLVKGNGAPEADLTALMRAIQQALGRK
jgi:hypothetical protein